MSERVSTAVYATCNADQFGRLLQNDDAPPLLAVTDVHGLLPGAAFCGGGLPTSNADVAIVATMPEAVLPSLARLLDGGSVSQDLLASEVDAFANAIASLPHRLVLVTTWIAPRRYSGGVLALDPRWGLDGALATANRHLVEALHGRNSVRLVNADHWQRVLGMRAFSAKAWFFTKDPFTFDFWKAAVADVKTTVAAMSGRAKKLIIVDLDNTLWGGEVGDAGVEGLRLGGHDAAGEAYQAFQRELRALGRRGVILAIASKNDEDVALTALDTHPEMVLRRADFAGWAISWDEKAANIVALCERLRISPADAVFLEDNSGERRAVGAAIPALMVPEWPANPLLFVDALRALNVFDVPEVTNEDLARGGSYAAARAASQTDAQATIDVRVFAPADLPRVLQLLNKTNQMNLTTRRFTEDTLREWLGARGHGLWTVRVSDGFADYGLTGVLALAFAPPVCVVTDFVMSCRVMSRGVEERMLDVAREQARSHGCDRIEARFVPTERNEPMRRFLIERSGLRQARAGVFEGSIAAIPVPA